jgi:hypothetical protein
MLSQTNGQIKGNYLLIAYWHNSNDVLELEYSWENASNDSGKLNATLIVIIIVPAAVIVFCGLGIFLACCRRKTHKTYQNRHYEIMNRSEICNDSALEQYMPVKYFLSKDKAICPICFEK